MMKNIHLIIFVTIIPVLLSCSQERFFNETVELLPNQTFESLGVQSGQHFAGILKIPNDFSIPTSEIAKIELRVDDELIETFESPIQEDDSISIDTRLWNEGLHEININIFSDQTGNYGVISAIKGPSIVYKDEVNFDQSRPTSVKIESGSWNPESRTPTITWERSSDLNFREYIITRESDPEFDPKIFRISEQNITSFIDTTTQQVHGFKFIYKISTSNGLELGDENSINLDYPGTLELNSQHQVNQKNRRPLASTLSDEIYIHDYDNSHVVKCYSTLDNSLKRQKNISWDFGMTLSQDESELYIFDNTKLLILNANNLEEIDEFSIEAENAIAGRNGRLYITSNYTLKCLDTYTGSIIDELSLNHYGADMQISSDNNLL